MARNSSSRQACFHRAHPSWRSGWYQRVMALNYLLLYGRRVCEASPIMISEDRMIESKKSTSYTELASNVASHTEIHVNSTISKCIK